MAPSAAPASAEIFRPETEICSWTVALDADALIVKKLPEESSVIDAPSDPFAARTGVPLK